MPTFATPEPISVALDLVVGDARIAATDRTDTVVEVRPSDPGHEADVRAAEQTRVEYDAGRLLVKAPKQRRLSLFGRPGSVDVIIDLPAGSQIQGDASVGAFRGTGRLGECRFSTSVGEVELDETGPVEASTGAGTVTVGRAAGPAKVHTGSGRVRVGAVDGTAVIKNSNGDTWLGEATGEVRVNAANGSIAVGRAGAGVDATTANGDIRVDALRRGTAVLRTSVGQIEIGVDAGTAARLDVLTRFGRVRSELDAADSPAPSDETAEVRARTSYGDIVIRRSALSRKEATSRKEQS
jgi:DUF4097 and DUF4098 domain-containing protein YvlB